MRHALRPAIVLTLVMCALTGVVYPTTITALAQFLFPWQANGSLVEAGGHVVGSALIAQRFTGDAYLHPRPSAAGAGYDATASGGTNRGPTNRGYVDTLLAGAVAAARARDGVTPGAIPTDMVTYSGSGLDPHVSPATAMAQVARVARARGTDAEVVRRIVAEHVEGRQLGFLGEPRVNVLRVNLALDSSLGVPSRGGSR